MNNEEILEHIGMPRRSGRYKYGSKNNSSNSTGTKGTKSDGKKNVKDMSDEELRKQISRLQLEQQYKTLMPKETAKVNKGKEIIKSVVENSAKSSATTIATAAFTYAGKQIIKKAVGNETLKEMFPNDKKKDKNKD